MKHPIEFDPATHTYTCAGQQLTSVTTLVKELTPPFDRDGIAARCARREGQTVEQVLAEWDAKGKASMQRGTDCHDYIDGVLSGECDPIKAALNERLPEMDAFDKAWLAFRERLDARVVAKETIVGDPELGIAGRVDVILDVTPARQDTRRCLIDWKTGTKFETQGRFGSLLPPFADVGDCELNRYSLQLSLYRLLLEREEPGRAWGDSYLIHLRGDKSFHIHRAHDYRERALAWLTARASA